VTETVETNDGLQEFTVITDEKFRVRRRVRARNRRDAAVEAIHGCAWVITEQEGVGYVESVPVAVYSESDDLMEFDLHDILNFAGEFAGCNLKQAVAEILENILPGTLEAAADEDTFFVSAKQLRALQESLDDA